MESLPCLIKFYKPLLHGNVPEERNHRLEKKFDDIIIAEWFLVLEYPYPEH